MNKLNQTGKLVVLAVVVVVVVTLVVVYGGSHSTPAPAPAGSGTSAPSASNGSPATPPATTAGATTGAAAGTGSGSGNGSANAGGSNATAPKPPSVSITFVTPVPGDTWMINTQNEIQWSRAAGVNGIIELLDASTLKLVGVILNVVGPQQTYYTWNTRDLLQSPTSPVKTTVTPGKYVVRVIWNANGAGTITSQPITITN